MEGRQQGKKNTNIESLYAGNSCLWGKGNSRETMDDFYRCKSSAFIRGSWLRAFLVFFNHELHISNSTFFQPWLIIRQIIASLVIVADMFLSLQLLLLCVFYETGGWDLMLVFKAAFRPWLDRLIVKWSLLNVNGKACNSQNLDLR